MHSDVLKEKMNELLDLYDEIKRELRQRDRTEFERCKAGGFQIKEGEFNSMYPSLEEAVNGLDDDGDEDGEEDEE